VIEVVERGLDDRERRIELVRELRCECAKVVGVRADLVEELGEAPRKIAELVAVVGERHRAG